MREVVLVRVHHVPEVSLRPAKISICFGESTQHEWPCRGFSGRRPLIVVVSKKVELGVEDGMVVDIVLLAA